MRIYPYLFFLYLIGSGLACHIPQGFGLKDTDTSLQASLLLDSAEALIKKELFDSANSILSHELLGSIDHPWVENPTKVRWFFLKGLSYFGNGLYVNANENFERARELVRTIDCPLEMDLYFSHNSALSIVQDDLNQFGLIHDFLEKVDSSMVSAKKLSIMYTEIGKYFYFTEQEYSEALWWIDKSQQTLISSGHRSSLDNKIYSTIFNDNLSIPKQLESLTSISEGVYGYSYEEQIFYFLALGDLYWSMEDYDHVLLTSLKEHECASKILDNKAKRHHMASSFVNLADAYMNKENYELALNYLDSAAALSQHLNQDYKQALYWNYLQIFQTLDYPLDTIESIFFQMGDELEHSLVERSRTEMKALTKREEQNIALIEDKAALDKRTLVLQRNLSLLFVFSLLLCAVSYFHQQKNRKTIDKLQNKLISSQLNPHFISNAIYSSMLMVEDEVPTAYTYLFQVHKFIRGLFKNYQRDFVSLQEEMNLIANYIEIERYKVKDKGLTFEYFIHPELQNQDVLITPMLIQPIVENCVNYRDPKNSNRISAYLEPISPNVLKCTILDSGLGIDRKTSTFPEGHSLYHIKAFCDRTTKKESLVLSPRKEITGTKAELLIKYKSADASTHDLLQKTNMN